MYLRSYYVILSKDRTKIYTKGKNMTLVSSHNYVPMLYQSRKKALAALNEIATNYEAFVIYPVSMVANLPIKLLDAITEEGTEEVI